MLPRSTSSFRSMTPSGSGFHLKHRISKREYKVVLNKTDVGTILLMHMYQGKGRWGFNAEVSALTWLVLYYKYHNEVRDVHASIYPSLPNNYTTMVPSSTSHEKARHNTHA